MNSKPNLSILTLSLANGGAERVISLLLKHLVNDFKVSLVLFYDIIEYEIPADVEVRILVPDRSATISSFSKVSNSFKIISHYNSFIKEKNIDISLAFLAHANIINGMMGLRHKKLKTIISERCFPTIIYGYNRFSMLSVKLLFPLFYNANDKLFSNSVYINKDLKENFMVKIPMSVIYNPIEFKKSVTMNVDSIISTPILQIVTAGTMEPRKNQKMIIDALGHLNAEYYSLTILGIGPLSEDLKNQVSEKNLSQSVEFKGRVTDVKEFFIKQDCFVLSSTTEGFPNALLEAISVGLPSISTNCFSGPLEMLNDNEPVNIDSGEFYLAKYGILINIEDDEALAKALTYFKENPQERKRYSLLGLQRAKDFELDIIYTQVKDLLLN
ncbi:MAG: glycosyltransferase [Aquaticitalea sp.]